MKLTSCPMAMLKISGRDQQPAIASWLLRTPEYSLTKKTAANIMLAVHSQSAIR